MSFRGHPMINRLTSRTTTTTTTTSPSFFKLINMDAETIKKYTKTIQECFGYPDIIHSKLVPGQVYDAIGRWCSKTWDGFACWDAAPPGTQVTQKCPNLVIGFNADLDVYKKCEDNGTWLAQPGSNRSWTDYTSCIDVEDLKFRTTVNKIYMTGYVLSIAALVISLVIFRFFKSIQCTRINLHIHLFIALMTNNILWILWLTMVAGDVDVVRYNKTWCQILHFFVNYFMLTTYFWMFCEALYLHISLVVVFVRDEIVMRWLKFIGWGVSLTVILVYAIVRYIYGDTERCWMEISETTLIITVPVLISLITSFVILVNVVRILITKVPQGPAANSIEAAKKALRATLILIPLFGLHYLLMPLHPSPGSSFETVYEVVTALTTSLQGLSVSILFCFTNYEVGTAAKAYWTRIRNRHTRTDDIPMTGLDVQILKSNETDTAMDKYLKQLEILIRGFNCRNHKCSSTAI